MVRRKKKNSKTTSPLPFRRVPRDRALSLLSCLSVFLVGAKQRERWKKICPRGTLEGKKSAHSSFFSSFFFFFPSFISCLAVLSVLAVIWGLGLYRVCVFFPFWKTIIRCLFVFLRSCLFPFETQRTGLTGRRGEGGWLGKGWGFRVVAPTGALFPPFSFLFFTAYFYLFFPFFLSL